MKLKIKLVIYLLFLLPVFSIAEIMGLPRLHNVVVGVVGVGLKIALSKKIKINQNFIFSWLISSGFLLSIVLRFFYTNEIKYLDFIFPLLWFFFPYFLVFWNRIDLRSRIKFAIWLFFLNFIYAMTQLIFSRFLNYSLMIHRTSEEYEIEAYSQDSPFSYLGLNNIHQFISDNLGAAVTGLVIERIDLMFLCIICLLQALDIFERLSIINKFKGKSFYEKILIINTCLAIILLTITGSSLSVFLLIFPFFLLINKFIDLSRLSLIFNLFNRLNAIFKVIVVSVILILSFFILLVPVVSLIALFDTSSRISSIISLVDFSSIISGNLNILFLGAGTVSSFDLTTVGITSFEGGTFFPRSLDIIGYTFNSFGLVGLFPFIVCYPLILSANTDLKIQHIILLCSLLFVGVGSPLSYVYTYSIVLTSFKIQNTVSHE